MALVTGPGVMLGAASRGSYSTVMNVLNESLTVVDPHFQILVLLQDVDDLVLQRQVLLHLQTEEPFS